MKHTKRKCEIAALCLALLVLLGGCAAGANKKAQLQIFSMDTVMLMTCYGPQRDDALTAAAARINALAADLDPDADGGSVSAVNAGAGGAVPVSADCMSIMSTAMSVYERSGGALDVGLYPVIRAWGFIDAAYRVPPAGELSALLSVKNTQDIALDTHAGTITLPDGMEISLGAVAKGYAGQAAVDAMREAGAVSAIVSLGGNVQTLGQTRPDGEPWQVAVTDPGDTGAYVGSLSVGQTAVVTSGGYQRFFEEGGETYIHIIDPAAGRPVENDLASVTVVCPDGAMADALSTALFVLGEEGALDYYSRWGGFELVLITKDGRVVVTPGLAEAFAENGADYTYVYLSGGKEKP